jgi:ribosomal-protein-alanine N-acetyltransferase
MPEAARAVVDFGFARMKLHKIVAEVRGDNHASARVMGKLGFALEGVLREQTYEAGRYYDEHLYGLLRREHRLG